MNNIIHTIRHTARAATMLLLALLLALLTAQTAWADGISYLDATGIVRFSAKQTTQLHCI